MKLTFRPRELASPITAADAGKGHLGLLADCNAAQQRSALAANDMARVTVTLVAVTCAFSIAGFAAPHLQGILEITPNWLETRELWRPLTANFIHNFVWQLLVNLMCLWAAGPSVEAAFQAGSLLGIYIASGVVGWIAQSAIAHGSGAGASPGVVGVSAALLACGYACRNQRSGVRQIVRASIVSGLFLASGPVLNRIAASGRGHIHVADYAHLGGFLTGLGISAVVLALRSRRVPQPGAAPTGGPAMPSPNSWGKEGPPRVN